MGLHATRTRGPAAPGPCAAFGATPRRSPRTKKSLSPRAAPGASTAQARKGTGADPLAAKPGSAELGGWDWPRTLAARGAGELSLEHLRRRSAQPRSGRLHCVVLDCSASMVASGALARAKGVLLGLLDEIYQRREHVALVCFGGEGVHLRLAPTKATAWNDAWIAPIGGGGGTPLVQALQQADELLARHGSATQGMQGWLWLMTDARTRAQPTRPQHADAIRVMDFESARVPLGRAQALAQAWDADYWRDSCSAPASGLAQPHGNTPPHRL